MPRPRRLGSDAEDRAADYLLGLGYTLLTRRAKTASGELDLVCLDGEVLVVVEVKSRSGPWQSPEEALGSQKLSRLVQATEEYVRSCGLQARDQRLDLVAIDDRGLRHWKNVTG